MKRPSAPSSLETPADGAEWVARLMSGEAMDEDHLACARWRALSADNEQDYQRARLAWRAAGASRMSGEARASPTTRWRGIAVAALALSGAIALVVIGAPGQNRAGPAVTHATELGQQASVALRFGGEITLGSRAEVSILESEDSTTVELGSGEAFFSVEPGHERTLVVRAGETFVTVTGTAFEVARLQGHVCVSVDHGSVSVTAAPDPAAPHLLQAGDRLLITPDGAVRRLSNVPPEIIAAWRTDQFVFVEEPLGVVFERLQQYTDRRIVLDPTLDLALLISATFVDDDVERVMIGLDGALPIAVETMPGGEIHVRAE